MDFLEKILVEKRKEVAALPTVERTNLHQGYPFYKQVKANTEKLHVIGEIKRASPSKGEINVDVDIISQAKKYQQAGVSAISVLTDEVFFKGTIADLQTIAQAVTVPVLCKDFIIDERQLVRAKNAGASMILLIVAALSPERLKELHQAALALDLEVLVETHNAEEMAIAQSIGAQIIGVNNRDLTTFTVDIQHSLDLAQPDDGPVYISESGFVTGEDAARVANDYHVILVGETLMRASNPEATIQELRVQRHD
ncbi:indole-3-glycerol phosphate synthase TrpC [Enterococcus saccharolyticus]|uniref:indole-3-glycerol phosphate synthase TrpC n=1 Tax=Enterococcus saccharolyticus TaxID=41997 RepID=UPI001E395D2B|nr:indole-3-glycerol phosphate synthase TrpC [Enterococcus saccharolyticus]MCD5002795.1 indole-3-glycerol phosphate synthase TrpC [Enterococcus saccharolyticus]